jgi:hypothetical protein
MEDKKIVLSEEMDTSWICPLHHRDVVVLHGEGVIRDGKSMKACTVYIGTDVDNPSPPCSVMSLEIHEDGYSKCRSSTTLPTYGWEESAKCYSRAVKYAKYARLLAESEE